MEVVADSSAGPEFWDGHALRGSARSPAIEVAIKVLPAEQARQETDGPESIATARTQAALVSVYQNQTRYEEGVALARTALRTMESSEAAMNLDLRNYEVARGYLERAVAVREIVYGEDHPAVTSSLNNLAKMHLDLGQYAEALPLYERSARIREAALGPQHPALASTFHAMGDLHRLWERHEQSVAYYQRAIAIQEANETPDLPFALRSYAEVLDGLGRGSEAEAARARTERLDEPE